LDELIIHLKKKLALDQRNTNHRCGSGMLMTNLWSGLMARSNYRISSTTSKVSARKADNFTAICEPIV
jgi:hypothetical protein